METFAGTCQCLERLNRGEAVLSSFGYTSASAAKFHPARSRNAENPGEEGRREV